MLIITVASSGDQARDILRLRRYLGAFESCPGSTPVRIRAIENKVAYDLRFPLLPDVDPDQVIETISVYFIKGEKVENHE